MYQDLRGFTQLAIIEHTDGHYDFFTNFWGFASYLEEFLFYYLGSLLLIVFYMFGCMPALYVNDFYESESCHTKKDLSHDHN